MILPNKLITFNESILRKMVYVLDEMSEHNTEHIRELYFRVKDNFEDINQYIVALDVLFVLGKIDYNTETQVVEYVKTNIL